MPDEKFSAQDRVLWGKVARTVRALPGRMAELEAFESLLEVDADTEEYQANRDSPKFSAILEKSEKKTKPASVPHHPIEKPVKRKISKGRLPLEARIDLHGLVQSEAHAMLHQFLVHAHERGMRHVLVITGKGSSQGSDGALKRAVPMWFSKPEFRFLISGYEAAARNHGGEGALYVRLSRRSG